MKLLPGSIGRLSYFKWTCELDSRFVGDEETTPELIATVIVHEATHARLFRRGIGYEEKIRVAVEDVCVRRECAFSTKLPNGVQIRDRAERWLTSPPLDMSDEARAIRRGQALRDYLLDRRIPVWAFDRLMPLATWVRKRRARTRKRKRKIDSKNLRGPTSLHGDRN